MTASYVHQKVIEKGVFSCRFLDIPTQEIKRTKEEYGLVFIRTGKTMWFSTDTDCIESHWSETDLLRITIPMAVVSVAFFIIFVLSLVGVIP